MDLLRSEIINITKFKPEIGLHYYNDLLDIIDNYHEKKPDTSIETCKAIIEGISKLIIHKIEQEPIHILDKHKFERLTKRALVVLNEKISLNSADFIDKIIDLLKILNTTRNDHCDIGHGRASVKVQINSPDFSEMIAGFTESISVYLLKKLDEVIISENAYDSEQMQAFNKWLDDNCLDFPILTETYSKVLYEYDRDMYYTKYNEVFITIDETLETKKKISAKPSFKKKKKSLSVIEFKSDYFTSENQINVIRDFAEIENLKFEKLILVLDAYFFTNEIPLRNQLIDLFLEKPLIEDQKIKSDLLKRKIDKLIENLTM